MSSSISNIEQDAQNRVIGSTPVKTVRNLKNNRQSVSNLREDEREGEMQQQSQVMLPKIVKQSSNSGLGKSQVMSSRIVKSGNSTMQARDQEKEKLSSFTQAVGINPNASFKRRPQLHVSASFISKKQSINIEETSNSQGMVQSTRESSMNSFSRRAEGLRETTAGSGTSDNEPFNDHTETIEKQLSPAIIPPPRKPLRQMKSTGILALSNVPSEETAYSSSSSLIAPPQLMFGENTLGGNGVEVGASLSKVDNANIDMEYAVRFVISKSKPVREKVEEDPRAGALFESRAFRIEYNMFLLKLVTKKTIQPDLRNVQKRAFEKLEKFFFEKLAKKQREVAMKIEHSQLAKSLFSAIDGKIKQLKAELNQTYSL